MEGGQIRLTLEDDAKYRTGDNGGRNYEYMSECPTMSYLASIPETEAMEKTSSHMGAKHFVGNDQEFYRDGVACFFTEQAFREGNLRAFEGSLRVAKVGGLMQSFERLGLKWASASYAMNTIVLRNEWAWTGAIDTDAAPCFGEYVDGGYRNADQPNSRWYSGACIYHDSGILGARCYEDAERRKIRLLKEADYNAVRSAHNPCSKALLDACDRLGVLVMDEYVDHWYIHKTEYDYVAYFDEWWRQDLTDMVEKDYNHPCVVVYSTGNEVAETAQEKGVALTKEMTGYLHGLDPTRPVTCGVNIFFNFLSSAGFGVYSDEKAKKEAEKAEKAKAAGTKSKKKKAVGSEFFNNLAGLLGDEFMKRWPMTPVGVRSAGTPCAPPSRRPSCGPYRRRPV